MQQPLSLPGYNHELEQEIREIEREILMRRHVFGRMVNDGTMKPDEMDHRIQLMERIKARLEGLR